MKLNIIGIIGTKGTGKDYFYETIKKFYSSNYNILRVSFGDQLKKYYIQNNKEHINLQAKNFLDKNIKLETEKDFFDAINILKNIEQSTVRSDLQKLGTEKKIIEGPDFWIKQAFKELQEKINKINNNNKETFVFITDVRFFDEALHILITRGIIITFKNYKMLVENIEKLNNGDKTIGHISEKLGYLPVDLGITYSLTGNIEQGEFYKFPSKAMLLSIMEDIRFLVGNRKTFSIDKYRILLNDWYNFFNNIGELDNNKINKKFSEFTVTINNIFRKDLGIIY